MRAVAWRPLGLALAAAVAALGALSLYSHASRQSARLETLQAQARSMPRKLVQPNLPVTLCRAPLTSAVAAVNADLVRRAVQAGLAVDDLSFEPLNDLLPAGVVGAKLHMRVRGAESELTQFVKASAGAGDSLFIDSADIQVGGQGVEAEFKGRLLCRRGL